MLVGPVNVAGPLLLKKQHTAFAQIVDWEFEALEYRATPPSAVTAD